MSDPHMTDVTARNDKAPRDTVALRQLTVANAWNVQGDPAHVAFVQAVRQRFAVELPREPNTTRATTTFLALWLGPSSWLLVHAADRVAATQVEFDTARDALNEQRGALFDVSASRVAFAVEGHSAAVLLAKSTPLDFHLRAFPVGTCAQSLFGHVNALFHRRGPQAFDVLVARSFGGDVWNALLASAAQFQPRIASPQPLQWTS
ncbi:MAG: hypothetical protein M3Z31_09820 [Pseudomonadota bacterium]|nr:hypothetical protein [Pseudomonadota bacterium]